MVEAAGVELDWFLTPIGVIRKIFGLFQSSKTHRSEFPRNGR
jgi:hypothetical protein